MNTAQDEALKLLDDLDQRHDFLLTELESLNTRIESVLNQYSKTRNSEHGSALTSVQSSAPVSLASESDEADDFDSEDE